MVLFAENVVGQYAQLIVGEPEEETEHEERLFEVEDTIVESEVIAGSHIVPAQGCVSVKAVDFIAGAARQQADFDGVLRAVLCLGLAGVHQAQCHENRCRYECFQYVCRLFHAAKLLSFFHLQCHYSDFFQ